MQSRTRGKVASISAERRGVQEITVEAGGERRPAVNYPALTGSVRVGDEVTLNTWAVSLDLGTGGVDFVTEVHRPLGESEPPGHIMKLRYTPLQHPVLSAEAPESPFHDAVAAFRSLGGMPVVCAELHSQLPAIAAAARWQVPGCRIAYVMTDGGALPIAFSHLVSKMKESQLIDATITAGHAFGGDYEAVNVFSALAIARVAAKADIVVVSQGPGSAGTATPLGFSGIDQGIALNAACALGGTAIAAVRLGFNDPRPRHIGLSHHTRTVLETVAQHPCIVALPRLPDPERSIVLSELGRRDLREKHDFVTVDAEKGLQALIDTGIGVTTMGRSIEEERAFFLAAAAAGLLAGQVAQSWA